MDRIISHFIFMGVFVLQLFIIFYTYGLSKEILKELENKKYSMCFFGLVLIAILLHSSISLFIFLFKKGII